MAGVIKARVRQAIAAPLAAGGAWAFVLIAHLFQAVREQWPEAAATGQKGVVYGNAAILLGFAGLALASLLGGVLLWKDKPLGRHLSKVALAAQLVFIAFPHFQYKMALFGLLGFGLAGSRFGLFLESNTQMFLEFDPDDLRAFVINIPAAAMLVALLKATRHPETTVGAALPTSDSMGGTG